MCETVNPTMFRWNTELYFHPSVAWYTLEITQVFPKKWEPQYMVWSPNIGKALLSGLRTASWADGLLSHNGRLAEVLFCGMKISWRNYNIGKLPSRNDGVLIKRPRVVFVLLRDPFRVANLHHHAPNCLADRTIIQRRCPVVALLYINKRVTRQHNGKNARNVTQSEEDRLATPSEISSIGQWVNP